MILKLFIPVRLPAYLLQKTIILAAPLSTAPLIHRNTLIADGRRRYLYTPCFTQGWYETYYITERNKSLRQGRGKLAQAEMRLVCFIPRQLNHNLSKSREHKISLKHNHGQQSPDSPDPLHFYPSINVGHGPSLVDINHASSLRLKYRSSKQRELAPTLAFV